MAEVFPFLVTGLVVGSMYGIIATGLVLTYRTSGVFNFAHGSLAMISAYVYYLLSDQWGLPTIVAMVVTVFVFAPLLGVVLERFIFRKLVGAVAVNKVIATVGLFVLLTALSVVLFGAAGKRVPSIFPRHIFTLPGSLNVTLEQMAVVAIAFTAVAALFALLNFTSIGTAILAVVDRRDLAALAGVDVNRISQLTWILGTMMAAIAGILLAPLVILDAVLFSLLVIQAFSGAMFGFLSSVPLALGGGILVGIGESLMTRYVPATGFFVGLRSSFSFLVLFAVLSFYAVRRRGVEVGTGSSLLAGQRAAADPARARAVGPSGGRRAGAVAAVVVAALLPTVLSPSWDFTLLAALPLALMFLSLTLLTGYAGQISLCQAAFMGVGAVFAARVTADLGLPFVLTVVLSGLVAVPFGLLVGIPALRISGLHLGLMTLGLGLLVDSMILNNLSITRGGAGLSMSRPSMPWLDLTNDRNYFWVLLVVLVVAAYLVRNLRTSSTGRVLRAIRDSEPGVRTIGIDPRRAKLLAFVLSAFLAGVAGALFASVRGAISALDFGVYQSLIFLVTAVVAGVASVPGAFLAALIQTAGPKLWEGLPHPLNLTLPLCVGVGAAFGILRWRDGIVGIGQVMARALSGPPPAGTRTGGRARPPRTGAVVHGRARVAATPRPLRLGVRLPPPTGDASSLATATRRRR